MLNTYTEDHLIKQPGHQAYSNRSSGKRGLRFAS